MRINKLFGARSITNLLYGLIMFLPFMAILGRVIYTQSNPNAINSYSGSWNVEVVPSFNTNDVETIDDLVVGNIYDFTIKSSYVDNVVFYFKCTHLYNWDLASRKVTFDVDANENYFYFAEGNTVYQIYSENRINFNICASGEKNTFENKIIQFVYYGDFNVDYISQVSRASDIPPSNIIFDTDGTLDNAFEFSLNTFVKDNANINNINFFGWFNGYFLNQSNTHNMLYLNFANWYMNYALLVSSGYLLFLALMWFINYVRRILDKSQNIDFGGF